VLTVVTLTVVMDVPVPVAELKGAVDRVRLGSTPEKNCTERLDHRAPVHEKVNEASPAVLMR
jgi:hypothetical protein